MGHLSAIFYGLFERQHVHGPNRKFYIHEHHVSFVFLSQLVDSSLQDTSRFRETKTHTAQFGHSFVNIYTFLCKDDCDLGKIVPGERHLVHPNDFTNHTPVYSVGIKVLSDRLESGNVLEQKSAL